MSKLEGPLNTGIKGAHITAVIYVASQMVQFCMYTVIFWSAAAFMRHINLLTGEDIFFSIFVIMFGTYGTEQAQQFGPSDGKGLEAAKRIYVIMDEESKIDATRKD